MCCIPRALQIWLVLMGPATGFWRGPVPGGPERGVIMPEQLPAPSPDEPRGDMGDQASRLQMAQEQAAIAAALAGVVHGSDAIEDRSSIIDPLEGPDPLDGQAVDGSDDSLYGGGMPVIDPGESGVRTADDPLLVADLVMTGLLEDGAAMALDEGSSSSPDPAATYLDSDDDPDPAGYDPSALVAEKAALAADLDDFPASLDDETAAEDLDALLDVLDLGHDLDDPQDPDGYGVAPAPDGGAAAPDQAELRDPVDDAGRRGDNRSM
jgi:hypothetical protein